VLLPSLLIGNLVRFSHDDLMERTWPPLGMEGDKVRRFMASLRSMEEDRRALQVL
jgi:DNA-binding winged helix-turn-helix (wHTH) protein